MIGERSAIPEIRHVGAKKKPRLAVGVWAGDHMSTTVRTGASFNAGPISMAQVGSRLVFRASASAFFAPRNVLYPALQQMICSSDLSRQ